MIIFLSTHEPEDINSRLIFSVKFMFPPFLGWLNIGGRNEKIYLTILLNLVITKYPCLKNKSRFWFLHLSAFLRQSTTGFDEKNKKNGYCIL